MRQAGLTKIESIVISRETKVDWDSVFTSLPLSANVSIFKHGFDVTVTFNKMTKTLCFKGRGVIHEGWRPYCLGDIVSSFCIENGITGIDDCAFSC